MIRKTLAILVVLVVVVSASVVVAVGARGKGMQGPGVGPRLGCPMMGGAVMRGLGLTDGQLAQMKELQREFLDATQAARDQIQVKAKEMVKLWAADEPDAAAIKSLASEIDALRVEIRNTCIDYLIRGHALLTTQQREKLREMIKDWPGMGPGCCMGCCCMGCCMGCGMGMGPRGGMGLGPGMGDGTGPRARMGTCPLVNR